MNRKCERKRDRGGRVNGKDHMTRQNRKGEENVMQKGRRSNKDGSGGAERERERINMPRATPHFALQILTSFPNGKGEMGVTQMRKKSNSTQF